METIVRRPLVAFRGGHLREETRNVPQETAIAVSANGSTHAVMMATPADLREFAIGLVLNEGIASSLGEIADLSIEEVEGGVDCRVWLTPERATTYVARRRQMTGPVGCGLCGVDSLALASPDLAPVAGRRPVAPEALVRAVSAMPDYQPLGRATRAAHAAAFASRTGDLEGVFEDVGRHNALDKLAGRLALDGRDPADGFLVLTSRVSVELIQKAARMRCPLLAAVSAPTDLAIRTAEALGITLVAVARGDEFEVFTHPAGIAGAASQDDDDATREADPHGEPDRDVLRVES